MALVNPGLAHFVIDARASLFTVQAFAAGIVAVVAHSPKFAIRDIVGEMEFVPESYAEGVATIDHHRCVAGDYGRSQRHADRREIERVMFDEVLQKNRLSDGLSSRVRGSALQKRAKTCFA